MSILSMTQEAFNRAYPDQAQAVQYDGINGMTQRAIAAQAISQTELDAYRALCKTGLVGRQASMTDDLLAKADGDFDLMLQIADSLVLTSLTGRQAGLFDDLINMSTDLEGLMRIADPLSRSSLVGRQARVFDKLISAEWNKVVYLTKILDLLSNTSLSGRQARVADRIRQLS